MGLLSVERMLKSQSMRGVAKVKNEMPRYNSF